MGKDHKMNTSIDGGLGIEGAVSEQSNVKAAKWVARHLPDGMGLLQSRHSPLTDEENRELEQSERIIKNGWRNFLEVGLALMKIQKLKLYRDKYATFELYCRDRLEISRPYAYNLIGSAEVYEDLSSIEDILLKPANEAQTRYLIGLPKDQRIAAWKNALEKAGGDPVTAKFVRQVVVVYKQKKKALSGLKNSARKTTIDKSLLISILAMLDEAEAALQINNLEKAQNILQQLRTIFSANALKTTPAANPNLALPAT